jgi:uncharacterized protein YjbJ (UPF0337 family)
MNLPTGWRYDASSTFLYGGLMNWNQIEGNWKQLKGKVREQWGKLSDDDFDVIEGKRQNLVGKIQERYGVVQDEAEKQVSDWETRQSEPNQPKL